MKVSPLLVTTVMSVESLDNTKLAAANNVINTIGRVPKDCLAHQHLLDLSLIEESGKPRDLETLSQALAFVVNRRVETGVFN